MFELDVPARVGIPKEVIMHLLLVALFSVATSIFAGEGVAIVHSAQDIEFTYQENFAPWSKLSCSHKRGNIPLDWAVSCGPEGQKEFRVHLKLSYYKRTIYGNSGYELLYWLTQTRGGPEGSKYNSSTFWFHNSKKSAVANVIQAATGVENDQAVLRLFVRL